MYRTKSTNQRRLNLPVERGAETELFSPSIIVKAFTTPFEQAQQQANKLKSHLQRPILYSDERKTYSGMVKDILIVLFLYFFFSMNTKAETECNIDPSSSINYVDGSSASEEEIMETSKQVKAYLSRGNEYLECLEKMESSGQLGSAKAKKLHNKAVDQMELAAAKFNRELRKFKRR